MKEELVIIDDLLTRLQLSQENLIVLKGPTPVEIANRVLAIQSAIDKLTEVRAIVLDNIDI